MDEHVDLVRLITALCDAIRAIGTATPAFMHDLHALFGTAQRDRVHHAAARRAPVARCDVHMQRRQAIRTVISVAPVRQRLHVAVADDATEAAVLIASAHAQTPWCR